MPPEICAAFSEHSWNELCSALESEVESAAVLLTGVSRTENRLTFTVNRVLWVPEEHYIERTPTRLRIASQGWTPALKEAADKGLHPAFFHTHPNGNSSPSKFDDIVDSQLADSFMLRSGVDAYLSLIVGGNPEAPSISGRVQVDGETLQLNQVRVVGRRLQIIGATRADAVRPAPDHVIHDRQVLAFGKEGQELLAGLHVGVVGAGGTGSAVVEQLTRLGVRHMTVIDDDALSDTNVTRVYGSSLAQTGWPKVDVVRANVERIGLGTELTTTEARVTSRAALEMLRGCDVIFGCTDDHAGRINLSRLAYWYLVPLFDLGVQIDGDGAEIRSITGRVTYVGPREPCLLCRGTVRPDVARDEQLVPVERERLAREGYARGLDVNDPSVVAYTTLIAATAVADLLERLFGFGAADIAGEQIIRIADRKMKGRRGTPEPNHFCGDQRIWGRGDQPNFLGQAVWPT